jgi:hypothetical protein
MNIERNLGNVERVIRLLLGGWLMALAIASPGLNGIEWFIGIVSTCLILNGIFSRCYFWYVLDIDTHKSRSGSCSPDVQV